MSNEFGTALTDVQLQYARKLVADGYTPQQAVRKAKEIYPTAQQANMQRMRRARKGGKK